MTTHKFKSTTKNMFAFVQERNESLLEREKMLREDALRVIGSAAMSVGALLDEINACGIEYHIGLSSHVGIYACQNNSGYEYTDIVSTEFNEFCINLYHNRDGWRELVYGDSGVDLSLFFHTKTFKELQSKHINGSKEDKKKWRRFSDLLYALKEVDQQWQKMQTVIVNHRVEILSENDVKITEIV